MLTKHNACNIIRWWLSGECKAHLADNQYRVRVVHTRPQTSQGEQGAKPEKLPLIFLSLECKPDIKEAHCILSNLCERANNYCFFTGYCVQLRLYNDTVKWSIIMMIHWCIEPKQAPNASNVDTLTFLLWPSFLRNTSAPQTALYQMNQRNVKVVWLQ